VRHWEPSNLWAMSRRYQERMLSGLATSFPVLLPQGLRLLIGCGHALVTERNQFAASQITSTSFGESSTLPVIKVVLPSVAFNANALARLMVWC
jgi:hypothetical protein